MFSDLDEEISIEEIKTAIKQLKNNKVRVLIDC